MIELNVGGIYEFYNIEVVYGHQELLFTDGDKFLVKAIDNCNFLPIVTIILIHGLEQNLYKCDLIACTREVTQ